MLFLSNVHQLFDTRTCQVYIHYRRWKDRPCQCRSVKIFKRTIFSKLTAHS
jgi:hypothetical protein